MYITPTICAQQYLVDRKAGGEVGKTCLVVRGASAIKVAINGSHFEGICGPLAFHGWLHIVVAIECHSGQVWIAPQSPYDYRILVLYWPA